MTTTGASPPGIILDGVEAWTAEHAGLRPPLRFTRVVGGHSNLTYRVQDAAGRIVVLRRPPLGELLPTAHDMGREFRVISGLWPTPVPVPEPLGFCEDPSVSGAPFYVMSFVDGLVLHDEGAATALSPGERRAVGESFVDSLVALHAVDPDDAGLGSFGRKEGYIERQLKRWYAQWNSSKTRELPGVDEVHDALASSIPDQGPARVVHGDYRLGNCIATGGRVAAILDWEIATLGDPLADLGYVLSHWAEPGEVDLVGSAPTAQPGFPSRGEVLDRYARGSGRDVARIGFYVAFAHWKSACIVEGVYARYLAGALDTAGVDLDTFRLSVERSVAHAQRALAGG